MRVMVHPKSKILSLILGLPCLLVPGFVTKATAATPCPIAQMGPPPGAGPGGAMPPGVPPILLATSTAPSDTSTSIVINPDPADQITCGKTELKAIDNIVFASPTLRNGRKLDLKMDLLSPKGAGKKPLVIYVTGGGFVMAGKENGLDLRTYVAEAGFVVASIQYRVLSDGADFHDGVADVKSAVRYLRAHAADYDIDPNKVAIWGESAGGYLVAMAGVTENVKTFDQGDNLDQSSAVQAVIDKFGTSDMSQIGSDFDPAMQRYYYSANNPMAKYINGLSSQKGLQDDPTAHTTANPLTYIHPSATAFLIFSGSRDNIVSPTQTLILHNALTAAGVHSTRYVLTGAKHGDMAFLGDRLAGLPWSSKETANIMVDFLNRTLK